MKKQNVEKILEKHKLWIRGGEGGAKANLQNADLREANLQEADLRWTNLRGADLQGANLIETDLRGADLSGCKGLLRASDFIKTLEKDDLGIICYKDFDYLMFKKPAHWKIEPGSFIEEVCDSNRFNTCGFGVNVANTEWINNHTNKHDVWKCRIRWEDLCGVIVPYNTNGKFRAERVELLERILD